MFKRLKAILSPSASSASTEHDVRLNAYATINPLPQLPFPHAIIGQRDLSDPDLREHIDGFIGYVLSRGNGEMTHARYHLMRHLQRVQHHISLTLPSSALPAFSTWAQQANAVVFRDDGSIGDPEGRVVIDAQGNGDPAAEIPHPDDARARKSASEARLTRDGIRVPTTLPAILGEREVQWRDPAEVVGRVLALLAVSAYAEGIRDGNPLDIEQIRERLPAALEHLSPKEYAFLQTRDPDAHTVTQMGWRYESVAILAWAAGLWPELNSPETICDVPGLTSSLLDAAEQGLPAAPGLHRASDMLDELDMTLRMHWVIREAELGRRELPADIIPGVIRERHHALNWLVRFEQADWDDVTTPT